MPIEENPTEETIGIMVYSYTYNTCNNYCIYTYDPIYDDFIDKICDKHAECKDESIIGSKIIVKSELDTIKWLLNGISNYAVSIDNLDEFFESIDQRDEPDSFNYDELLMNDEESLSILNLEKKKLKYFPRGYSG